MKKIIPYILFGLLVSGFYYFIKKTSYSEKAAPIAIQQSDTISIPDTSSIKAIDSLKDFTIAAVRELHKYEQLKKEYEQQEAQIIYKPVTDSSQLIALRARLAAANKEITRLRGDLASVKRDSYERPTDAYSMIEPGIEETPDNNSIVITFDGRSKNGNILTDRLLVYLIPYNRKVKQHMRYETSCDEKLYGNAQARFYNGVYYFNDVQPGKYLIKVCTYYGNFRVIEKQSGKLNLSMLVSPPIQ